MIAPTSVYQELVGAGGLSSIERKDVRDHLAQFHLDLEWAQKQIDYFRALKVTPVTNSGKNGMTFARACRPGRWTLPAGAHLAPTTR